MKKLLSMVIALMLVFSCASALAELTFTTGGTAGTYYAFGGVLAQYISDHSDVTGYGGCRRGQCGEHRHAGYGLRAAGLRAERRGLLRRRTASASSSMKAIRSTSLHRAGGAVQ